MDRIPFCASVRMNADPLKHMSTVSSSSESSMNDIYFPSVSDRGLAKMTTLEIYAGVLRIFKSRVTIFTLSCL